MPTNSAAKTSQPSHAPRKAASLTSPSPSRPDTPARRRRAHPGREAGEHPFDARLAQRLGEQDEHGRRYDDPVRDGPPLEVGRRDRGEHGTAGGADHRFGRVERRNRPRRASPPCRQARSAAVTRDSVPAGGAFLPAPAVLLTRSGNRVTRSRGRTAVPRRTATFRPLLHEPNRGACGLDGGDMRRGPEREGHGAPSAGRRDPWCLRARRCWPASSSPTA